MQCTRADTANGDNPRSCVDEELYAEKLRRFWSGTPLSFKQQCISSAQPPSPSYIVLRDCINNNVLVEEPPAH